MNLSQRIASLVAVAAGLLFVTGCQPSREGTLGKLQQEGFAFNVRDYLRAAAEGNIKALMLFHETGMDPNATDANGNTALLQATHRGQLLAVKYLLDEKASITHRNKRGRDALTSAAASGQVDVARLLLELGADPGSRDEEGWSGLSLASYLGHAEMVRLLAGLADQERIDEALLLGSFNGDRETIAVLLSHGADINTVSPEGLTPLMIAAEQGHTGAVAVLLQNRANPHFLDRKARTAAELARMAGHREIEALIRSPKRWPTASLASKTGTRGPRNEIAPLPVEEKRTARPLQQRRDPKLANLQAIRVSGAQRPEASREESVPDATPETFLQVKHTSTVPSDTYAILGSPDNRFRYVVKVGDRFRSFDAGLNERDFEILEIHRFRVVVKDLGSDQTLSVTHQGVLNP